MSHHIVVFVFFNCICQGIGNGLPLGAVVTTPEIASVMAQKIQFNTFGGNPVCSAGGHAVLRVLDKEKRQEHCVDVGSHLTARLRDLQERYDSKESSTLLWKIFPSPFTLKSMCLSYFNCTFLKCAGYIILNQLLKTFYPLPGDC